MRALHVRHGERRFARQIVVLNFVIAFTCVTKFVKFGRGRHSELARISAPPVSTSTDRLRCTPTGRVNELREESLFPIRRHTVSGKFIAVRASRASSPLSYAQNEMKCGCCRRSLPGSSISHLSACRIFFVGRRRGRLALTLRVPRHFMGRLE